MGEDIVFLTIAVNINRNACFTRGILATMYLRGKAKQTFKVRLLAFKPMNSFLGFALMCFAIRQTVIVPDWHVL